MIIDFHTHIFSPQVVRQRDKYIERDPVFRLLYANPKAKLATASDLIQAMDEQGIDMAVVQNIQWSSPELCAESNDYIMEAIAQYPDRLTGFGMVQLDSPDTALPELERCIKYGLKGVGEVRLSPAILKRTDLLATVIREIINSNLILLTHTSEPVGHLYPGKGDISPEALYPLISDFSELKLVCAHWGGGLPFYALMPEVKRAMENVFFDSAASPFLYEPQIFKQTAQLVGAHKILFGSDYPLLSPERVLKQINNLDLPEETVELMTAGNACRVLDLKIIR
jgi:predicted TIM-barrel fold metal-dependent hydrolase